MACLLAMRLFSMSFIIVCAVAYKVFRLARVTLSTEGLYSGYVATCWINFCRWATFLARPVLNCLLIVLGCNRLRL